MASSLNNCSLEAHLEKSRHIKYWTRCLKTLLPQPYTGNDSNRMYLAFLMISALDLLDALTTVCNENERRDYVNWIYRCQHPNGGFRMWPGTDFGDRTTADNAKWDPANVPATYFALATLLVLGDDLKRVRRKQTLQWLRKMQRNDGSFGETIADGRIEGGKDSRFGYCAAGIRRILRGNKMTSLVIDGDDIQDIDVDSLVHCVRAAESFDGGIADEPLHEPHAGYTFCSLGALYLIDRFNSNTRSNSDAQHGPSNPQEVVRWLVYRQTDLLDPDSSLDSEFLGSKRQAKLAPSQHANTAEPEPAYQSPEMTLHNPFDLTPNFPGCTGMNGRTNKVADTCYAFWAGASLHILGQPTLYDHQGVQKYLLEKTQHPVLGGFGKFPGDLPDLYHSYLGLAALSLAGSHEIKELDAAMCVSKEASARLAKLWATKSI